MPFSKVKAITFDAAGTLLHVTPSVGEVYREIFRSHGIKISADALQSGFQQAFKTVAKNRGITNGEDRERDFWKRIVAKTIESQEDLPKHFERIFADLWETFSHGKRWKIEDQTIPVLSELKRRGYHIALFTNWDKRVRSVLKDLKLEPYFDHIFISSEVGFDKPDPEIFQTVAHQLNLLPFEILHVGDSWTHDIEGATQAGWNALQIHGKGQNRLESLAKLLDLLRAPPAQ